MGSTLLAHEWSPPTTSRIKMFLPFPFNFSRSFWTAIWESFPRLQITIISESADKSFSSFFIDSSFSRSPIGMLSEFSSEQISISGSVRTSTRTCFGFRDSENTDAEIRSQRGSSFIISSLSVALDPQNWTKKNCFTLLFSQFMLATLMNIVCKFYLLRHAVFNLLHSCLKKLFQKLSSASNIEMYQESGYIFLTIDCLCLWKKS